MGVLRPALLVAVLASSACGLSLMGMPFSDDGGVPDANDESAQAIDAQGETSTDASIDIVVDAPAEAADGAVSCTEPGAQMYAGHCYFTLSARTQPQAKTDCAAVGAHLVTVTSSGEHTFLGGVGTGDRWIGLQADAPTNDRNLYKWITNEAKPVSYWYPNDPDNMGPCVAFRSALSPSESWVDRGCGESNVAICERQ